METSVTVGAVLVGLVAVAALFAAARAWQHGAASRGRAMGWLVVVLGAALQLANLLVLEYSWTVSVVASAAMVLGLLMAAFDRTVGARPRP